MADESQQNDIPEYPADSTGEAAGETAAGKHRAGEEQAAGESKKGNKKLLIGLVALIAIILVIVQLVIYAGRNGDDSAEDNAGIRRRRRKALSLPHPRRTMIPSWMTPVSRIRRLMPHRVSSVALVPCPWALTMSSPPWTRFRLRIPAC